MLRLISIILCLTIFWRPTFADDNKLDSLYAQLGITEPDSNRVNILLEIAMYFTNSNPKKAYQYGYQAELLSRKINFGNGIAKGLVEQGKACYYLGQYEVAVDLYLKALELYEQAENAIGIAGMENNIGVVYEAQGRMEDALVHYNKALVFYARKRAFSEIARVENNIGNIYYYADKYPEALKFYEHSLHIKDSLNDLPAVALSLNNIGNVYGSTGDYPKSREYFMRSLAISESMNDLYTVAMTTNNIGLLYQLEGDTSNALKYIRKSLSSAYTIGARDLIKDAYLAMSELHKEFRNFEAALRYYVKYSEVKDSLINLESSKNINELQEKYQSEKREKQILEQRSQLIRETEFKNSLYWIIALIGAILFLAFIFAIYLVKINKERKVRNLELSAQKGLVEIKNNELFEKNKSITDSITYASRIQKAILPPDTFIRSRFDKAFVFYQPKDIVSGDFYWMEKKGSTTLFAVADCTGHGVPGAFVSIAGSNLLTEAVVVHGLTSPAKILDKINLGLSRMLHQEHFEENVRDGMDIALCSIDHDSNKLIFCGAFNPCWIIRNNEMIELETNKFPVGAYLDTVVQFKEQEFQLEKDDALYIFSDGYPDQFGGANGKKMKYKGFRKLLLETHRMTPQEQKTYISNYFESWRGDLEQIDDVCLMGIRI